MLCLTLHCVFAMKAMGDDEIAGDRELDPHMVLVQREYLKNFRDYCALGMVWNGKECEVGVWKGGPTTTPGFMRLMLTAHQHYPTSSQRSTSSACSATSPVPASCCA